MVYNREFYTNEVMDAENTYNRLALAAVAEGYTPTWEDGVALNSAFEELQEARRALARFESNEPGMDDPMRGMWELGVCKPPPVPAAPAGWESVSGGIDNPA